MYLPTYPSQRKVTMQKRKVSSADTYYLFVYTHLIESLTKYYVNKVSLLLSWLQMILYFTILQHISSICHRMKQVNICPRNMVTNNKCTFAKRNMISWKCNMCLFTTLFCFYMNQSSCIWLLSFSMAYFKYILHYFPHSTNESWIDSNHQSFWQWRQD